MNKRYLRKLASLLEDMPKTGKKLALPVKKFDMEYWYENSAGCGSTACAFGVAALHPYFRSKGLKTSDETSIENGVMCYSTDPVYKGEHYFAAAAKFFELTDTEAQYLFSSDAYGIRKGPKTVAKRLRDFADNGMDPKHFLCKNELREYQLG